MRRRYQKKTPRRAAMTTMGMITPMAALAPVERPPEEESPSADVAIAVPAVARVVGAVVAAFVVAVVLKSLASYIIFSPYALIPSFPDIVMAGTFVVPSETVVTNITVAELPALHVQSISFQTLLSAPASLTQCIVTSMFSRTGQHVIVVWAPEERVHRGWAV